MKSISVLSWVTLVSVSVLGACGGVSNIGSGSDPVKGGTVGGSSGTLGGSDGKGAESTGASSMGAQGSICPKGTGGSVDCETGTVGGKDPGGMGASGNVAECMADADCKDPVAPCEPCADGSYACTKAYCAGGKCVYQSQACNGVCETDKDCPAPDVACQMCADGTTACPTTQCLMGKCQTSVPGCGGTDPCKGLECGSECKACGPNGMCDTNQLNYCNADGKCAPGLPQCADPGTMCKTVMDCGAPPPKCVPCGNDICATFDCIMGSCVFACPPNPDPQCKTSEECPALGDQCKMCGNGKCAVEACLKGSCELVCPL